MHCLLHQLLSVVLGHMIQTAFLKKGVDQVTLSRLIVKQQKKKELMLFALPTENNHLGFCSNQTFMVF